MQQGTVVHSDHGNDLQIVVLTGDSSQRRTGAQDHALLIGGIHVDHTGGGSIDIIIVGTGVQGIDLGLNIVHVALRTGDALGNGLHGGVVQGLHLTLALLHHGLDLSIRIAGSLIGSSVKGLLRDLTLVGLVLVVVRLIFRVRLAEVVGVVLHALQQLIILVQLGLVDLELAFQIVLLHIDVGALDVRHKVALVHIAAFRDIHFGDGTGIAGHDVGLVAGLHGAGVLTDINAVGLGAPHQKEHHKDAHQNDKGVTVGRHIPVQHDTAVLQVRQALNFHCHNYLVSIKTSITASSES